MLKFKVLIGLLIIFLIGLAATGYAEANPSTDFYDKNGEVFDDWGICRTRAMGEDGFYQLTKTSYRPVITFESLGEEAGSSYALGREMAAKYPDKTQLAEAIFLFVRDRVEYTSDEDQFKHDEFAQNADEVMAAIQGKGLAYGDCEDSTVLLAVIYQGAGLRSAIAVGEGHTATLVYLPGYKKARAIFELDGEPGWVWAEATGKNNPLGWAPKEFVNVNLAAYEITEEELVPAETPKAPSAAVAENGGTTSARPFPFIGIIFFLWFFSSLFRRRRRA